jgi:hypothetical protein
MSMTNREESEAAEHETYPGPGPLRADEGKRGIHPVEQMVDAAIDRIAREREASLHRGGPGHALALAPKDGAPSALATTRRGSGKLRWKGLEVSEEFRNYAERVARGEDLPPYKGRILAEPDAAFPWEPAARKRAAHHARRVQTVLWGVGAALVGVASWSLVVQLGGEADAWQRSGESALSTTVLASQPSPSQPLSSQPNTEPTARAEGAEATAELAPSTTTASPPQVNAAAEPSAVESAGSMALAGMSATPAAHASAPSPAERSPQPVSEPTKASTARDSVGVFVTTRVQSNDVVSGPASPVASSAGAAPVSPNAAVPAPGSSSSLSASSNAITPSEGAIAHVDPKKEPTAEPSGMGALLVETPSF